MDSLFDEAIPCLGLAWSNLVTSRFEIRKTEDYVPLKRAGEHKETCDNNIPVRIFEIIFSPEMKKAKTKFIITDGGITAI